MQKLPTIAIWAFAVALLLIPTMAHTQECPVGYRCLTGEKAAEIAVILDQHNCMVSAVESGNVRFQMEPNQITINEDGQVFSKEEIQAELRWCQWHLELSAPTEVLVHVQEPDLQKWGFRLRIRLGVALLVPRIGNEGRLIEPLVLFEPFFFHHFHAQIFAGLTHFGLAAGIDLTKNLNFFGGVGLGYVDTDIAPLIGVSLSFN